MKQLTKAVMQQFCREYDLTLLDLGAKPELFTDEDFMTGRT